MNTLAIISGGKNPGHPNRNEIIKELFKEYRYDFIQLEDFSYLKIQTYEHLIIYTSLESATDNQLNDIIQYINQKNRVLFLLHEASIYNRNHSAFKELLGRRFENHEEYREVKVKVVPHSYTKDIPETFAIKDELYLFKDSIRQDIIPFLKSEDGKILIGFEKKISESSKLIYISLGHDEGASTNKWFQAIIINIVFQRRITMDRKEFIKLIELIESDLTISDMDREELVDFKKRYLPLSLVGNSQKDNRGRVRSYLKTLKEYVQVNEPNSEVNYKYENFKLILVAILYSTWERLILFEFKAAEIFKNEFGNDDIKYKKQLDLNQSDVEKVVKLIKYHKIANTVLGYRLFPEWFTEIEKECGSELISILAAICYDTPNEVYDEHKKGRRETIIEIWKMEKNKYEEERKKLYNSGNISSTEDWFKSNLLLWDFPLCKIEDGYGDTSHGNRVKYDLTLLNSFIKKVNANSKLKNKSNLRIAFHYLQSRLFVEDFKNALGNTNEESLDDYTFDQLKPDLYKVGTEGKNKNTDFDNINQYRMIFNYALPKMIGSVKQEDKFDWLRFIKDVAENSKKSNNTNKDNIGYYLTPLKNYLPLRLLKNYFEMGYEYSSNFIENSKTGEFETVSFEMRGLLDSFLTNKTELKIPTLSYAESIRAIVIKFLASYFTNLGLCGGYDENIISTKSWKDPVLAILRDEKKGFELLIKYIETFMRSHDVRISNDNFIKKSSYNAVLNDIRLIDQDANTKMEKVYSIGIDIGGTSIKFRLVDEKLNLKATYRLSTEKNKGKGKKSQQENKNCMVSDQLFKNSEFLKAYEKEMKSKEAESDKYSSLKEFAEHLYKGIEALLNNSDYKESLAQNKIDVIGICWPGAIREEKIAGASGIFKFFKEEIATNYMRKTHVEQIRKLDLVKELTDVIYGKLIGESKATIDLNKPNLSEIKLPVIALCNDGTAEALGRIKNNDLYRLKHRWAVLKFGTGTASSVWDNKMIHDGIVEFGKLTFNVYSIDNQEMNDLNKTPNNANAVNAYASQNLFPNVFKEMIGDSNININSFEISKIGSFYLDDNNETDLEKLKLEIGYNRLYEKLDHIISREEGEIAFGIKTGKKDDAIENKILKEIQELRNSNDEFKKEFKDEFIKIEKFNDLKKNVISIGEKKIKDIIYAILKKNDRPREFFEELFDRSGSILSDIIMLIHEHYKMTGIILCGGVLQNNEATKRVIDSVKMHLKSKYHIDFKGIDEYEKDYDEKTIDKKLYTTIYHNYLDKNFKDSDFGDKGEEGSIYHAKIVKLTKDDKLKEEQIVCLDEAHNYKGCKESHKFESDEYKAIEVVAVVDDENKTLCLFKRARDMSQPGQLLFQSGKINDEDITGSKDKKDSSLPEEVFTKGVKRELKEELNYTVNNDRIVSLGDYTDKGKKFHYYLYKVNVLSEDIKKIKLNSTISKMIPVKMEKIDINYNLSWENKKITIQKLLIETELVENEFKNSIKELNPEADDVYCHMLSRVLKNVFPV